ncbi:MAG: carbon-nitrogen hydrolase family protein [Gordonia sp.]|uniref:carbon-nitrogen hydrolase family protein n=1 Tax=Gordonia sp. (in: high G+C Gram-positive bacteria) TaxID=84139 RepID=UPI001DCA2145|nr:carbon-nitrogen hydrolase family protein [Gordonia sp. (in: high G+C Gram-positive bacteria)]MCB1295430.1 carbon-nitrogen hydrolase family protein [Gordonia sp. (in: high G+C Gram-positive bacteria)]
MPETLRLALWQCAPLPRAQSQADDHAVADNLARLEATLAQVSGTVDLLVTPEMFVSGYNVGAEAARFRADPVLRDMTIPPVDGSIADALSHMCARHRVAVVYGCGEIGDDGSVYNTARIVDAAGVHLGSHHKSHLYGGLDRDMFTAGTEPAPVIEFCGWGVGLLICYEVEFPEMTRSLAARGADLICVPTANMVEYNDVQRVLLPSRALENQVFLAYANYIGTEGDLTYGGLSVILGPAGAPVTANPGVADLVTATLVHADIEHSRSQFCYLDDRNPDVY